MNTVSNLKEYGSAYPVRIPSSIPRQKFECNSNNFNKYPQIYIHCEFANVSSANLSGYRSVLVPVHEGVVKRIVRTFFENGFRVALQEATSPETIEFNPNVAKVAQYICDALDAVNRYKQKIFPHKRRQLSVNDIVNFTETRDWCHANIRCIAWHPNCFKIAVAGGDDSVRIYTESYAEIPVLKTHYQKSVTSIAWRPFTTSELAVGCDRGICLWTVESNVNITRATSQATLLQHPKSSPITSIQWNSDGTLLAASSIGDTDILIWNMDSMQCTALKCVGPTCSFIKWSSGDAYLFAATSSNMFRVWSTEKKWTGERWNIVSGTVQSACWSPCSNFLLFITTEEPILYELQFYEEQVFKSGGTPTEAVPVIDLSSIVIDNREIGGQPQALVWDPKGLYLAIMFKDTNCVAIYTTSFKTFQLRVSPLCFVSGAGYEYPTCIAFQSKNKKNSETILNIGWSNGRIQYVPLTDNII
ncbi:aladin-like [Teleopsis dalmanni]|uniref:aladin-like n=1 Tax=Teleopsis dalmanni TaxID=139649 RepID=UPI0018CF0900|nr:aladin-like [Teleopsis dalmanni]